MDARGTDVKEHNHITKVEIVLNYPFNDKSDLVPQINNYPDFGAISSGGSFDWRNHMRKPSDLDGALEYVVVIRFLERELCGFGFKRCLEGRKMGRKGESGWELKCRFLVNLRVRKTQLAFL